jgi:hypothetical protein
VKSPVAAWFCHIHHHIAESIERKQLAVKSVKFLGKRIPVPGNVFLRVALGLLAVFGGFLGFLPILGFWMLPLGLLILSIDFPPIRRFRRVATVKVVGTLKSSFPVFAARIGLN